MVRERGKKNGVRGRERETEEATRRESVNGVQTYLYNPPAISNSREKVCI